MPPPINLRCDDSGERAVNARAFSRTARIFQPPRSNFASAGPAERPGDARGIQRRPAQPDPTRGRPRAPRRQAGSPRNGAGIAPARRQNRLQMLIETPIPSSGASASQTIPACTVVGLIGPSGFLSLAPKAGQNV